jgi:hypothetical protein
VGPSIQSPCFGRNHIFLSHLVPESEKGTAHISGAIAGNVLSCPSMEFFWLWFGVGFGAALIFASFFEWTLHRYLMHRPFAGLQYAFKAHAVVHHQTFKADHTYHLNHEKDKETIPMAWWNGPLLIAMLMIPAVAVAWPLGIWGLAVGALLTNVAYYGTYEYIHWCMHLPKHRRLERSWLFRRLNGHHLLHHRYMHKNFNVVMPLADLVLRTLLLRSKTRFAQATGPAVPNVQPHTPVENGPATTPRPVAETAGV